MIELVSDHQSVKLGELLVHAGVLQSGDVVEAAQVSRRLKVPIGRVMIASGCIKEDLLQAALEAQLLLRDERVELDMATAALQQVAASDISFEEALFELKWIGSYNGELGNLAELLLDSNIVTEQQLETARTTSSSTQLPLGSALVLEGILSPKFFPTIMQFQEKVITGEMSRREATSHLRSAFMLWVKAEESFPVDAGLPKRRGLDDTGAVKSGRIRDRQRSAFNLTMAPQFPLEPVLPLQPESQSMSDNNISFVELLTKAGIVQPLQIQQAMARLNADPDLIGRLLVALDVIDEDTFKCGLRSQILLKKRLINSDQAVTMMRQTMEERPRKSKGERSINEAGSVVEFSKQTAKRKRTIGGAILAASIAGLAAAAFSSKRR